MKTVVAGKKPRFNPYSIPMFLLRIRYLLGFFACLAAVYLLGFVYVGADIEGGFEVIAACFATFAGLGAIAFGYMTAITIGEFFEGNGWDNFKRGIETRYENYGKIED
jgi:hypothetical protein